MKRIVIILAIANIASVSGKWLSPDVKEVIEQQRQAYDYLTPKLNHIYVDEQNTTTYNGASTTHYSYYFTPAYAASAQKALFDQFKTRQQLIQALSLAALGDGFMTGILIGIIKKCTGLRVRKETVVAALLCILGITLKQRDVMGSVPYINRSLQQEDCSGFLHTLGYFILMGLGATVGVLGTDYTINRVSEAVA